MPSKVSKGRSNKPKTRAKSGAKTDSRITVVPGAKVASGTKPVTMAMANSGDKAATAARAPSTGSATSKRSISKKIGVMISSKCMTPVPWSESEPSELFSDLRRKIKDRLEAVEILGHKIFSVWINEDGVAAPATRGSWEECMAQVKKSDLLLVLYNGDAGWTEGGGNIGVCHAELQTAMECSPQKVYPIKLVGAAPPTSPKDVRFQSYFEERQFFSPAVRTQQEALNMIDVVLANAVTELASAGVREQTRNRRAMGECLDWAKLSFAERADKIKTEIESFLHSRFPQSESTANGTILKMGEEKLFVICHAIPAALTVAAARESVGQPFHRDHSLLGEMKDAVGPVHIIGCNRAITETQSLKQLGLDDAVSVAGDFGVLVADPLQKTQMVFLSNCIDGTSTAMRTKQFLEWLEREEQKYFLKRARSRKKILAVVAQENI
jgi:hypothetical protein